MERDFSAQIKSIEEFTARFNEEETTESEISDSVKHSNFVSLFDFQMSHEGLDDSTFIHGIRNFIETATKWDGRLSVSSSGTIAEAVCQIVYKGKEHYLTLFFQREPTKNGEQKWALTAVNGLKKMGLYNEKRMAISPVDHETHFMSLQDIFQENKKYVPCIRSNEKEIDEMSFFFGMVISGAIKFEHVEKLKIHFTDLPHYVFTIEEIGREGTNCGWLITSFKKMSSNTEKIDYIQNLYKENKSI